MRIRIFTDGACSGNPGTGGWGVVILTPTERFEYSGKETYTTNNRMELRAILESLRVVLENNTYGKDAYDKISIYSDSAYCINAINQQWLTKWELNGWKTAKGDDVKNKDLWVEIQSILSQLNTDKVQLKFIKVKGHSGNKYNELADSLAKAEIAETTKI